jgi:hypothetical protein
MIYKGYELYFTRRRYGKTMFTWIYVKLGESWQSTGDPLQKIMPSKKDLDEAIDRAQAYRSAAA